MTPATDRERPPASRPARRSAGLTDDLGRCEAAQSGHSPGQPRGRRRRRRGRPPPSRSRRSHPAARRRPGSRPSRGPRRSAFGASSSPEASFQTCLKTAPGDGAGRDSQQHPDRLVRDLADLLAHRRLPRTIRSTDHRGRRSTAAHDRRRTGTGVDLPRPDVRPTRRLSSCAGRPRPVGRLRRGAPTWPPASRGRLASPAPVPRRPAPPAPWSARPSPWRGP